MAFYIGETAGEIDSINITCQLIKINTGRYNSVAMVLQKDSEYTQLIKYQWVNIKIAHQKTELLIKSKKKLFCNHLMKLTLLDLLSLKVMEYWTT